MMNADVLTYGEYLRSSALIGANFYCIRLKCYKFSITEPRP